MKNNAKILSTKLKMPLPRKDYIKREHLFKKLQDICDYKLILVKGSCGNGKTTLVSSFLKDEKAILSRWISLDQSNNDIISFWSYFFEAVINDTDLDGEEVGKFFDAIFNKEDVRNLLTVLINQLCNDKEILIVLDDFHFIRDKALLDSVEFFIKNSSDNVHFLIITREEPEIYLGDLLVSGKLLVINENEMKFSAEEGICFLKETLKVPHEIHDLEQLHLLSEGWIGGLQMLALAAITNKNAAINNIKYLNKHSIEYLSKEILGSLSEEERSFLIKTAILSYFDENICNSLLSIKNAGNIIQSLTEKNLFIIRIDEDRDIYRYHNLFGEFLRDRFSTLNSEEKTRLQREAGRIFIELGDYDEAIRQYQSIESFEDVVKIIKKMEPEYKAWSHLSNIPMQYYGEDRDLVMQRVFFLYFNNDFDSLKNLFIFFKEKSETDQSLKIIKLAKSMLMDFNLKTDIMPIAEIESVPVSSTTKAILYIKSAAFLHLQHRFREALVFIEKAEAMEEEINNPFIKLSVLGIKSGAKEELGDLVECEKIYDRIFSLVEGNKILSNYSMNLYVGITGVFLKSGRLDKAEEALSLAMAHCSKANIYQDAGYLYNMMELKLLRGQYEEAYDIIKKLLQMDVYSNIMFSSGLIKYLVHIGEISNEMAVKYIQSYESCDTKYIRIEDKLSYAKVLHFLNRKEEALNLVDDILQTARSNKFKVKLAEALMFKIKILCSDESLNKREILNLLREAVHYCFENNIVSPYLLEGQNVLKLLIGLNDEKFKDLNSGERIFIKKLIGFLKKENEDKILSERELEVLRELATGASNREIAERLCISVATVKTHMINIYSKLPAGSRVEAVEKSRDLGLI